MRIRPWPIERLWKPCAVLDVFKLSSHEIELVSIIYSRGLPPAACSAQAQPSYVGREVEEDRSRDLGEVALRGIFGQLVCFLDVDRSKLKSSGIDTFSSASP